MWVPQALRYLAEGYARGNVVITVELLNETWQRAASDRKSAALHQHYQL